MDRRTTAATSIYYPESDGKPMGKADAQIDALIHLLRLRRGLRPFGALTSAYATDPT
jgi:hypothetical protein